MSYASHDVELILHRVFFVHREYTEEDNHILNKMNRPGDEQSLCFDKGERQKPAEKSPSSG
jgi:hypothetical protein